MCIAAHAPLLLSLSSSKLSTKERKTRNLLTMFFTRFDIANKSLDSSISIFVQGKKNKRLNYKIKNINMIWYQINMNLIHLHSILIQIFHFFPSQFIHLFHYFKVLVLIFIKCNKIYLLSYKPLWVWPIKWSNSLHFRKYKNQNHVYIKTKINFDQDFNHILPPSISFSLWWLDSKRVDHQ